MGLLEAGDAVVKTGPRRAVAGVLAHSFLTVFSIRAVNVRATFQYSIHRCPGISMQVARCPVCNGIFRTSVGSNLPQALPRARNRRGARAIFLKY